MLVQNWNGTMIDFDVAVTLMVDEIREEVHRELSPCTEQEFFSRYEFLHSTTYGEEWELSKENPVY